MRNVMGLQFLVTCFANQTDKFDVKDERRVGRDDRSKSPRTCIHRNVRTIQNLGINVRKPTICLIGRNSESTLLVDTHPNETFIPAANDLANTNLIGNNASSNQLQHQQNQRGISSRVMGRDSPRSSLRKKST